MVCAPIGSALASHVARPAATASEAQPVIDAPSAVKLAVPVEGARVAGAVGVTVAVKVIGLFQLVVGSLDDTMVVVAACTTAWGMSAEDTESNPASPLNAAATRWSPTGMAPVVQVATPASTGWAEHEPSELPKRLKLTVPPAGGAVAGAVGVRVAVKVTASEKSEPALLETTAIVAVALLTVCVRSPDVLEPKFVSPA
jgi:hypothetical protein